MEKARLMDKPEDYEKLGINPKCVEAWESGIRNSDDPGNNEVWYFDANFDDGSKVIVGFRPKTAGGMTEKGFSPNLNLDITRPDGTTTQEFAFATPEESSMSSERCDVRFGKDWCKGDFQDFDIHIEGTRTTGCDLHYHALTEPFRQGTSQIALGDHDEYYYTDLCVPKCEVTGTLRYDGKSVEVHGFGYHDHQWMNISPFMAFHHWLWGRMYTEKYVVYIYDFVCAERFGFRRIPFFIVADNATGEIVFETDGKVSVETDLEMMKVGKRFPRSSRYHFDNGDRQADFDITWEDILETRDTYGNSPADQKEAQELAQKAGLSDMQKVVSGTKEQYDAMGIQPTYIRFFAKGGIRLTIGGTTTESRGTMIYEYNYVGREDGRAGV